VGYANSLGSVGGNDRSLRGGMTEVAFRLVRFDLNPRNTFELGDVPGENRSIV
jgi:hypothetical protein